MSHEEIIQDIERICPEMGTEIGEYNWELRELSLKDVRHAGDTPDNLVRAIHFADQMQVGAEYPPIIVIYDPDGSFDYELEDGWHRSYAAKSIGRETLRAYVGTHMSIYGVDRDSLIELNRLWKAECDAQDNGNYELARQIAVERVAFSKKIGLKK